MEALWILEEDVGDEDLKVDEEGMDLDECELSGKDKYELLDEEDLDEGDLEDYDYEDLLEEIELEEAKRKKSSKSKKKAKAKKVLKELETLLEEDEKEDEEKDEDLNEDLDLGNTDLEEPEERVMKSDEKKASLFEESLVESILKDLDI